MLKSALISEKTMKLAGVGSYTFWVDENVTKSEIARLVARKFGVDVVKVATVNLPDKIRNLRTRRGSFKVAGKRKAVVTVKTGQKIDLFEVAARESEKARDTGSELVTTAETVKEKKSLLKGTKVKIEKARKQEVGQEALDKSVDAKKKSRQLAGKSKGEK